MSLAWVVIGSCLDGIQRDVSLAWVVIGSSLDGILRDDVFSLGSYWELP